LNAAGVHLLRHVDLLYHAVVLTTIHVNNVERYE
jgi:hypothetical protein